MTKNSGVPAKIKAGIARHRADTTYGRRSVRWLAERSGIPYSTLQAKLAHSPETFTVGELILIADALGVELDDLYAEAA